MLNAAMPHLLCHSSLKAAGHTGPSHGHACTDMHNGLCRQSNHMPYASMPHLLCHSSFKDPGHEYQSEGLQY